MAKLRGVECRKFIKAAIEKADEMGVPVSIAVVGPEGHLIAIERMDDAGFVTPETAWAKAYTVAAFRSMSPRFPDGLVIQQWFKERNPQLMIAMTLAVRGTLAKKPISPTSSPARSSAKGWESPLRCTASAPCSTMNRESEGSPCATSISPRTRSRRTMASSVFERCSELSVRNNAKFSDPFPQLTIGSGLSITARDS